MPALLIRVEGEDVTDLEFLRTRAVGAVEEVVSNADDEGRLDETVEVSWEMED